MEQAIKLRPCPFCGSDDVIISQYGTHLRSTLYVCENCGCRLETGEETNYGTRWNERNIIIKDDEILDIINKLDNKLDKKLEISDILHCIDLILNIINGETK